MSAIRTALISVYDKTGLVPFASSLAERGIDLVSTGGTARALRDAGLEVRDVEELTGQPEMLGGRVKTLHPRVFGGILARREVAAQMQELEAAGSPPVDMVVVNLYPFRETVADPDVALQDALEQIDIGGVSLLRAAYKNFGAVWPVVDPADYGDVLAALDGPDSSPGRRLAWARKAVAHTAAYEAAICNWLCSLEADGLELDAAPSRARFPGHLTMTFTRRQSLRYGENPHQRACSYAVDGAAEAGIGGGEQLQGKELSFNNLLDADAAWQLAWALASPGAVVIKHANPCGAATGETLVDAYVRARATDPMSAFGGIVGLNAEVDGATAAEIAETFIEVVVAPGFSEESRRLLGDKKSLRLVRVAGPGRGLARTPDHRWIVGGMLVQDRDGGAEERWECVTERRPTPEQERDLRFLWSVIAAVKSNAIIVGRGGQLLGVGAGQMSRVDAGRFATWKARDAGHDLASASAASDAFFPFPDGVEALAEAGITAVVQPGGSKRDPEVIAAANRLDVAMILTGARHFRH